jgi:hypothetical protein
MEDKTLYLSAYNEIFINTEKNFFDRNRLYGGIGYRFSKYIRTEIGVMNQTTNSVSRNQINLISFVNFENIKMPNANLQCRRNSII